MNKYLLVLVACLLISAVWLTGCDFGGLTEEKEENQSVVLGEEFKLRVNETAVVEVEQFKITFLEVTTDSRCPVEVRCVHSGEAVVKVKIEVSGEEVLEEYKISTIPNEIGRSVARTDNYVVDFTNLEPSRKMNQKIEQADYVVTFKISKENSDS